MEDTKGEERQEAARQSARMPSSSAAASSQNSATLGLPTIHVGKYTLYGTIGEGAFGKVKLGVNRDTGERVAVKIMDKGEIREQDLSAQVRREIHIMRFLEHKHIVRMHEVLTSNTKLYIVMELVTGGELFDRLETRGRVDEPLARKYFHQLVDGVDFCHKSGVAHRDLKPENLLLDENGDIKITDFGFSAMKNADVNAGLLYTQCGTPDYCAPEIIEHPEDGYNGAKVDVWSCGIILYALLVGRLPFREEETEKLYDLILACEVVYPPYISAAAKDLLSHLLVRDPANRFSLADIKRHPWFLADYKGDDARLLKKPAFYKANHTSSRQSSSEAGNAHNESQSIAPVRTPVVHGNRPQGANAVIRSTTPAQEVSAGSKDTKVQKSHANHSVEDSVEDPKYRSDSDMAPSRLMRNEGMSMHVKNDLRHMMFSSNSSNANSQSSGGAPLPSSNAAEQSDTPVNHEEHRGVGVDSFAEETSKNPQGQMVDRMDVPSTRLRNVQTHQGSGANASESRTGTIGRVAAMVRARENQGRPNQAATDSSYQIPQSVFTQVFDRPATPVSRVPGKPVESSCPQNRDEGHIPSCSTDGGELVGRDTNSLSQQPELSPPPPLSGSTRNAISDGNASQETKAASESDDDDSVEDYQNKPVPALNLPNTGRFSRNPTPKQGHIARASLDLSKQQRSDIPAKGAAEFGRPSSTPSPMSNCQQQHALSVSHQMRSTSPSPAAVTGGIGARGGSPYRRFVAQAASINPHVDGRASPSSGRTSRQTDSAWMASSPISASNHSSGYVTGFAHPVSPTGNQQTGSTHGFASGTSSVSFTENGSHVRSSSDELNQQRAGSAESPGYAPPSEHLALRIWNLVQHWSNIVGEDSARNAHAHQYLRLEFRSIQGKLFQIRDNHEKLAVFQQFMLLFGKLGLQDETLGRLDDVDNVDYDRMPFNPRGTPTDLSSEDDCYSTSPVIVSEPCRSKNDLYRRRELSDLLNQAIHNCDNFNGHGPSRENSADGFLDLDDLHSSCDINSLKAALRYLSSVQDDSYIAERIDRVARGSGRPDTDDDSGSYAILHAPSLTGSPPPSASSVAGSGDAFIQQTKWGGPSGTEPTSVRISRSIGPSSYVPGSFEGGSPGESPRVDAEPSGARLAQDDALPPRVNSRPDMEPINVRHARKQDMAASMGLDDVEYYGSDRRQVSAKLKGVLMQIKARNQRLGENDTWFTSSQPSDLILQVLCTILGNMRGRRTLKRDTKRKLKCVLPLGKDGDLHVNIELVPENTGLTRIEFKRSRADRGRTSTCAFNTFFESVRQQFIEEMQARGSKSYRPGTASARLRSQRGVRSAANPVSRQHESLETVLDQDEISQEQLQAQSQPLISKQKYYRSIGNSATGRKGVRMAPRAASDMR